MSSSGSAADRPVWEVSQATNPIDLHRAYRFWYDIYVTEMGKEFSYADHQKKILVDELDETSVTFVIEEEIRILGTVRVTTGFTHELPEHLNHLYDLERFDAYRPNSYALVTRLMVDPELRGSGILGLLMGAALKYCREKKIPFVLFYCQPALVQLYEQIGGRRYKENVQDEDTGLRIPLVMLHDDLAYLKRIRSPVSRLLAADDLDQAAVDWFYTAFPELVGFVPTVRMNEDDLWDFFAARIHMDHIPLIGGLSEEQVRRFMNVGTVLKCRAGEKVISRGEVGDEMYLVLSGAVEVGYQDDRVQRYIATFGTGQVFGEMALVSAMPRSADVVALTDLEVLVITRKFIEKLIKIAPEVANRVLLNLAVILAERLRMTTTGWVRPEEEPQPPILLNQPIG